MELETTSRESFVAGEQLKLRCGWGCRQLFMENHLVAIGIFWAFWRIKSIYIWKGFDSKHSPEFRHIFSPFPHHHQTQNAPMNELNDSCLRSWVLQAVWRLVAKVWYKPGNLSILAFSCFSIQSLARRALRMDKFAPCESDFVEKGFISKAVKKAFNISHAIFGCVDASIGPAWPRSGLDYFLA